MLTTTLKTKLSHQAERDIASIFHQLTLMAEWCSISLPDSNARVTAGRVEKNLTILVRDIASRETNKTPADLVNWLALERDQIKEACMGKIESLIGRMTMNFFAQTYAKLGSLYQLLAEGKGGEFSQEMWTFSANLASAREKLVTTLLASPQSLMGKTESTTHFNINMPVQPLDVTVSPPNVEVTVSPPNVEVSVPHQSKMQSATVVRDESGKITGIEVIK